MKMKNVFLLIAVLAACLLFGACASFGKPKEVFTVELTSPSIELGDIEAQFEKFLAVFGLKKGKLTVYYYPKEDAVCLYYNYEFMNYHQFWSKKARLAFIEALAQYNEDYDARILKRSANSLKKYNVILGYLTWYFQKFSVKAKANMNIELGYYFKDKAPYFTVNQRDAEYIDPIGSDNNRTSVPVKIYYTRAQAAELAAFFDQSFLNAVDQGKSRSYFNESFLGDLFNTGRRESERDTNRDVY